MYFFGTGITQSNFNFKKWKENSEEEREKNVGRWIKVKKEKSIIGCHFSKEKCNNQMIIILIMMMTIVKIELYEEECARKRKQER